MEQFVVWDKEKIRTLTDFEREQWFDVYNYGLVEDRGFSLDDPNIEEIRKNIKNDYFMFLKEFRRTADFCAYFLWVVDDVIVSVCRVSEKTQLLLEGVETHRDWKRMGYAKKLLKSVFEYLKELDYCTLYSRVSVNNTASLRLHDSLGFLVYEQSENQYRYRYDIMKKRRVFYHPVLNRLLFVELLMGIPYHKDNNNRYYKDTVFTQYVDLVISTVFLNVVFGLFANEFYQPNIMLVGNIVWFFVIQLSNLYRLVVVKDQMYLKYTYKYLINCLFVVVTVMIFTILIINIF